MVVCISVWCWDGTPHPPSCSPKLVDEPGVLEVSRPLRFASSCAVSCPMAAQRLLAITDHGTVCSGFRQTRYHRECVGLCRLGFDRFLLKRQPRGRRKSSERKCRSNSVSQEPHNALLDDRTLWYEELRERKRYHFGVFARKNVVKEGTQMKFEGGREKRGSGGGESASRCKQG